MKQYGGTKKMATIIGAKEGSHFQDARRITEIIIAHGADMTRDAIDRAINTWDQLIKIGLNNHQTPKVLPPTKDGPTRHRKVNPLDRCRSMTATDVLNPPL